MDVYDLLGAQVLFGWPMEAVDQLKALEQAAEDGRLTLAEWREQVAAALRASLPTVGLEALRSVDRVDYDHRGSIAVLSPALAGNPTLWGFAAAAVMFAIIGNLLLGDIAGVREAIMRLCAGSVFQVLSGWLPTSQQRRAERSSHRPDEGRSSPYDVEACS